MTNLHSTDQDWATFGQTDPYWAVLTDERFRRQHLTPEALIDFFQSGEAYVEALWETIRTHVDAQFAPTSALDFGCGVGRLVIPLARRCQHVVGVDVAPAMLDKAREHCLQAGLTNVQWVQSDDALSGLKGDFDLIHSCLVFQHIPPVRGEVLFQRLLDHLRDGGVGALQFCYARSEAVPQRQGIWTRLGIRPFLGSCYRRLMGGERGPAPPLMQMNNYNLNHLFHIVHHAGVAQAHVDLHCSKKGIHYFRMVFQKASTGAA
jgi:SAM-dependent methyltransferase